MASASAIAVLPTPDFPINTGLFFVRLHKIWTRLFAGNAASRRVTEKCGFAFEGRLRHSTFKDGRWQDELRYGLVRDDWAAQRQPEAGPSA